MNKLLSALIVAVVIQITICQTEIPKCWKMVNQQCGFENRTVFTGYSEGPIECRDVQYDSGEKENRTVCYHIGDVWCEEGGNINDCKTKCCSNPVTAAECQKCHCGFEEQCITREFPIMAYEKKCIPSQIPVFQTKEFPKNCQTQVEVNCSTNTTTIPNCHTCDERYICGQNTVQEKCGVREEEYQCGYETVKQFKCYKQINYQCGTVDVQFWTGQIEQTNPRPCCVEEQYDCNQTVTQEVCSYVDVYQCQPVSVDINWCLANCNDISKLLWADQQTCLNSCFCGIKKQKSTCTNQTFKKMCYRKVNKTCYDEKPKYETKQLPKECTKQIEIHEDVQVPKYCIRYIDIFCDKLVDIYCTRQVQVCDPVTTPTKYCPKYKSQVGAQAWCDGNCIPGNEANCLIFCNPC